VKPWRADQRLPIALALVAAAVACSTPATTASKRVASGPVASGSAQPANSSAAASSSVASTVAVAAPGVAASGGVVGAERAASERDRASRLVVHVVPIGDVSEQTLVALRTGFEAHAEVQLEQHAAIPLSAVQRAKRPGRYEALSILMALERVPGTAGGKVLGVTAVDIVAEKDGNPEWGVLGLGSIDGVACVLSTHRMRRAWESQGRGVPEELVNTRLWKTAVHEVGHTLGLEHCPTRGCLMEDGHGTVATTDAETALCPSCAAKYERAARALRTTDAGAR
jgi:archaemetzincin